MLNDVLFRPQDTSAETATLWLYCSGLVVTARFKPLRFIEWMLPRLQTLRVNTSTELLAFLLEEQEGGAGAGRPPPAAMLTLLKSVF